MKKTWLYFNDIFPKYEKICLPCHIGKRTINAQRFTGLSLRYEEIKDDDRIQSLRESLELQGWRDYSPGDLDVYRMPKGDFMINNGGNHRAILSNELGLPRIKAMVTIVVPQADINHDLLALLRKFESQRDSLLKKHTYHQLSASEKEAMHQLSDQIDDVRLQIGVTYLNTIGDDLL